MSGNALPHALEAFGQIDLGPRPLVGLDFDGTLSPIAPTPDAALLPEATRRVLTRLASAVPVVIVSGRDAADVRARLQVPVAGYAGSHGFDLTDGEGVAFEEGPAGRFASLLPALDGVERLLRARFEGAPGIIVERKRFGVATHYRGAPHAADEARAVARALAEAHPDLMLLEGKAVAEIRPAADWNKGKALCWLASRLGPVSGVLYVGDDTTDEDAFGAIVPQGAGVLVADEPRPSAASYRVADTDEVRTLLARLADRYAARDPGPR